MGLAAAALLAAGCGRDPLIAGISGRPVPCVDALSRPAGPAPGVSVGVACMHYDVEGNTAAALRASMDERGPRDEAGEYHGYTAYELSYGFDTREDGGRCAAASIAVRLRMVHVLPALAQGVRLDPALSEQWSRFIEGLTRHEAGHGRRDADAAVKLGEVLHAIEPSPTCAALRERAHAAFDEVMVDLRRANRLYDMTTGHGAAQGALLP